MIMTAMLMMKTEMHDLSKNKAAKVSLLLRKRKENEKTTNMNKFMYVAVACELNLNRMNFNIQTKHSYVHNRHIHANWLTIAAFRSILNFSLSLSLARSPYHRHSQWNVPFYLWTASMLKKFTVVIVTVCSISIFSNDTCKSKREKATEWKKNKSHTENE